MRTFFQLLLFMGLILLGGIALIKFLYGVSWRESVDIADQFVSDLLG